MYKRSLLVFGAALALVAGASVAGEGPRTVAECLPEGLAQWVKDMGAETALDQVPGWVAEEFRSGAPGPSAMFAIVGDKVNVVRTKLSIKVKSGDHLVAVTKVIVADEAKGSRAITIGEKVLPGDEILEGLVFNLHSGSAPGDTSAVVEYGESKVVLDDGHGIFSKPCLKSCSVTCTGGNACCWDCGAGNKCVVCCSCTSTCPNGAGGGDSCSVSCAESH